MAVKKQERSYEGIPAKVTKDTEELMCKLNEVEWNNRAQELAEAHTKVADAEIHRKNVMDDLANDVKAAKARETKLAHAVATRSELREVTVETTYDYEAGFVIKVRTDTKEEISRREMTTSERQTGLFDNEAVDANDVIESRHEEAQDGVESEPEDAEAPGKNSEQA